MDLGCIDLGCVEKPKNETSAEKDSSPKERSDSKYRKTNKSKDTMKSSISSALSKLTSQISKPPRRKTSPVNWFPRKNAEPYLKRKIKMLQEVDGMHSTLDETLGDSNLHYSKLLREKIAIREAAEKAMTARKAAMVEASWCRILLAARIESKGAQDQLLKAEASAAEACEAARAVGVIMNDISESMQNHNKMDGVSPSTMHHTVSATFETAFEVDKQVACAVKAAFIKLANCPSINRDDFKELLLKISENPDSLSEFNVVPELKDEEGEESSDDFTMDKLVDMMLDRLQCLKEDELASLATIVATSGLNAALAETETNKHAEVETGQDHPVGVKVRNSRVSLGRRTSRNSFIRPYARGTVEAELPSLDKFLVKRLTRLEREVLEAKNARKNDEKKLHSTVDKVNNIEEGSDLGSVLVKHSSKLEKEIETARMKNDEFSEINKTKSQAKQDEVLSLDKVLVKRLTRLEREVLEAKNATKNEEKLRSTIDNLNNIKESSDLGSVLVKHSSKLEKEINAARTTNDESFEMNKTKSQAKQEDVPSLDKVLVKRMTRLEKEVEEARIRNKPVQRETDEDSNDKENADANRIDKGRKDEGSLDKVLVKHVSRLEREKMEFCAAANERMQAKPKHYKGQRELESDEGSLDQVLVKHKSRLEKEKTSAAEQEDDSSKNFVSRKEAREKELQAAWGGLSLGNSIRPHVSRLQREKAAWIQAEEEERKKAIEQTV